MVAVVGVSGSGKTSLAIGTLYAEGIHRFLEGLSTYTRRRLTQAQRPDVDRIDYLPPALALRQRPPIPGPRSTVGTMSEVLNVLRLMMSRLGSHLCPNGHLVDPSIATQGMEIVCPVCGAALVSAGAAAAPARAAGSRSGPRPVAALGSAAVGCRCSGPPGTDECPRRTACRWHSSVPGGPEHLHPTAADPSAATGRGPDRLPAARAGAAAAPAEFRAAPHTGRPISMP